MPPDSPLSLALLAAARRDGNAAELRCRMLLERANASRAWQVALQHALARAGLTEAGFAVLTVLLARHPEAIPRTHLAAAAELSPTRTADALLRLELSGLIERARDGQRGRAFALRLTAAGAKQIATALRSYVQAAKAVTGQLAPEEVASAIATSAKIQHGAARVAARVANNA